MKKLLTLLAFAATMLSFAACSNNDDDNEGGSNKTEKIKLVSKVDGIVGGNIVETANYYYDDQNRLIKIESTDKSKISCTYTENTITCISIWEEDTSTTVAKLNNKGNVSSIDENTYTYDSNDCLTQIIVDSETYTISLSNENIIKIQGGDRPSEKYDYDYEYSGFENKTNLNMFAHLCSFEWLQSDEFPFFPYGTECKNLISKIKRDGIDEYTFQYTMTSDGYIDTMTETDVDDNETYVMKFSYIEVDKK